MEAGFMPAQMSVSASPATQSKSLAERPGAIAGCIMLVSTATLAPAKTSGATAEAATAVSAVRTTSVLTRSSASPLARQLDAREVHTVPTHQPPRSLDRFYPATEYPSISFDLARLSMHYGREDWDALQTRIYMTCDRKHFVLHPMSMPMRAANPAVAAASIIALNRIQSKP
jgi:hypothetical protein